MRTHPCAVRLVAAAAMCGMSAAGESGRVVTARIRAQHYDAFKQVIFPGDVVFVTCTRGRPNQWGRRAAGGTGEPAWSESKFARGLAALKAIQDPRVRKAIAFSSVKDLKANLNRLPEDLAWAAYNMERGMTPREEFRDIEGSVRAFAALARSRGLKASWAPTGAMIRSNPKRFLAMARYVDALGLQHQKALQFLGVNEFVRLTVERAAVIKRINPRCEVVVQVVVGRGSDEDLVRALKRVWPSVQGVCVFTMREPRRAAAILKAVRGLPSEGGKE